MMSKDPNQIRRTRMHRAIALSLSIVLGAFALGGTAPVQAASSERSEVSAYTCLWYRVRAGDTLGELAIRYGTTVLTLRRVNGLKTTRIYTGQTLCIPRATPPRPSQPPAGPWRGEYWNNTIQSGPPALVRNDAAINFNLGFGSPDPQRVQADYFSASWTRTINFAAGIWRFSAKVDDGFRLQIDNKVVLDSLDFVGLQTRSIDVPLTQGNHTIRVDYVEQSGVAFIQFNYSRVGPLPLPPPSGDAKFNNGPWTVEYFANPNFAGAPTSSAVVCCLSFDWRGGPPASGVPGTFFTARFSQVRYFPAGVYQFVVRVDDGVRLYLDGNLIINEFREQSPRTFIANANLGAGNHSVVVEYVQYGGLSNLSLYWDFLGEPGGARAASVGSVPYYPPLP